MNIQGPSRVTLSQAKDWARSTGGHQRYIDVADHYWELAPLFGIPPEVAYGQAGHETGRGHYTGVVPPTFNNWAGIKTEEGGGNNDPNAHQKFPTARDGVIAHLWHLWGYMGKSVAEGPKIHMNDPRFYKIVKHTQTVEGLGGAWAPSATYGTRVAAMIQTIIQFAEEHPVSDIPGVPLIAADDRHMTTGRRDPWPTKIIGHHTDGFDSLTWLTTSPNSDVSASCLFWHNGTIRAQLVLFKDTPHTTGYMNDDSLSFEWERFWATQQEISDEQYRNISHSVARMYLAERARGNPFFATVMRRDHLADHNDYYSTTCPGNLDMNRVFALARPETVMTDPGGEEVIELNGFKIVKGFKAYWEELGRSDKTLPWRTLGYPLENEWSPGPGVSYQGFERGTMKWQESEPPPYHLHHKLLSEELPPR